eukprot:3013932-Pleurochrysis_carterae.AAC.6
MKAVGCRLRPGAWPAPAHGRSATRREAGEGFMLQHVEAREAAGGRALHDVAFETLERIKGYI